MTKLKHGMPVRRKIMILGANMQPIESYRNAKFIGDHQHALVPGGLIIEYPDGSREILYNRSELLD